MGKRMNLTDQKFGILVVKELAYINKSYQSFWKCECECGNMTIVPIYHLRSGHTKSCGCLKNRKGFQLSDEHKKKISESRKGIEFSDEHKKNLSKAHMGNKIPKETRKKMSEAQQAIKHKNNYWLGKCGKGTPNYNPDLTDEDRIKGRRIPGYKEWVKAVYERDNYTCQICGKRGGKLIAHHLESYNSNPELRTKLSNGATVCEKHHVDFHHQYGYGNNTKKQFIQYKGEYNDQKETTNK